MYHFCFCVLAESQWVLEATLSDYCGTTGVKWIILLPAYTHAYVKTGIWYTHLGGVHIQKYAMLASYMLHNTKYNKM